ncbi:hypothetical protein ACFPZ0_18595, partial [Streptomonospora nanhaiensis]
MYGIHPDFQRAVVEDRAARLQREAHLSALVRTTRAAAKAARALRRGEDGPEGGQARRRPATP